MKNNPKVLITGAGTGIGLSCVKKFLAQGWEVVAHYNRSAQSLKSLAKQNKSLKLIQADFVHKKEVLKFIDEVKKLNLTALINNAGIHDFSRDEADRIDGIQKVLMVNTVVPVLLAEAALERMKDNARGTIVNVSSIGVKYGSNAKTIFYGISKGGLESMTKSLAREGAAHNVLVNTVRVGVTDTSFHDKLGKNMDERTKLIPLKRMATPDEIAGFIYHLSAENTFITGETIAIAGGE